MISKKRKIPLMLLSAVLGIGGFTVGLLFLVKIQGEPLWLETLKAGLPMAPGLFGGLLLLLLGLPNMVGNAALLANRPFARLLCGACGLVALGVGVLFFVQASGYLWLGIVFAALGVLQSLLAFINVK